MSVSYPTVLIADNDDNVSFVLGEVLRQRQLQVEVVRDGLAALDRIAKGGIAAFVCDLDMPRLSGEELLERLDERSDAPPVVVSSGFVEDEVSLIQRRPVRHVFRKPFDVLEFAVCVERLAYGSEPTAPAASDPALFERFGGA